MAGNDLQADMFAKDYADVFTGDERWQTTSPTPWPVLESVLEQRSR